jgi:hypothetical protein
MYNHFKYKSRIYYLLPFVLPPYIKALLKDLRNERQSIIHVDNQGAMAIAQNPVIKQKSKHMDIKYHFTKEKIENGTSQLKYVYTYKQKHC